MNNTSSDAGSDNDAAADARSESESAAAPEQGKDHALLGAEDEASLGADFGISPLSVPDFTANPNVYYALDRSTSNSPPVIRIRQLTFDPSATTPVAQGNIVMGGARTLSGVNGRNANALGVTADGVFYYTTQSGTDSRAGTVDVWRYEMMAMPGASNPGGLCWNSSAPTGSTAEGWACAPRRVVTDLSLNSAGGGTIVGGAVGLTPFSRSIRYVNPAPRFCGENGSHDEQSKKASHP